MRAYAVSEDEQKIVFVLVEILEEKKDFFLVRDVSNRKHYEIKRENLTLFP